MLLTVSLKQPKKPDNFNLNTDHCTLNVSSLFTRQVYKADIMRIMDKQTIKTAGNRFIAVKN
jgi:hypothetical protein